MQGLDERIGNALEAWVDRVGRRPRPVLLVVSLLTLVFGVYLVKGFAVDTDNKNLLAEDVPFRHTWEAFSRRFPTLDDALLVVVDGETPELARDATAALSAAMKARGDTFHDVFVPGWGSFFERNGLLYRSVDELDALADQLTRVQPVLAALARDPTVANLSRLVEAGLDQVREQGDPGEDWPVILENIRHATVSVYEEAPVWISWEEVLLEGSALDPTRRHVIVADPVLDFQRMLPAAKAIDSVRSLAAGLQLDAAHGVRVRITGNPALSYEEMTNLLWDVGVSGVVSLVAIVLILSFAFHSWRLVLAAGLTLVAGLVWTGAFGIATVHRLNLVSIAFAVLFVGLGIDFAIHLGMHYAAACRRGRARGDAMRDAVRETGSSLVLCTLTTAIGFYAFVPTEFRGVGELGLISGTGMFVIFLLTVTFFPALVAVLGGELRPLPERRAFGLGAYREFQLHPFVVCGLAAVLGVTSLGLLPRIRFDSNVIELRDPRTESVQTFQDLLAQSETSPWQIDLLAPSLDAAAALAKQVRELPEVDRAITLRDYVPGNQGEKIEILDDLALIFDVPSGSRTTAKALPVAEQIAALRGLHDYLNRPWLTRDQSAFGRSALQLRDELGRFLTRVESDPDPSAELARLEEVLLGPLPQQLERIQGALHPSRITLSNLPQELVSRMLASDGSARVQVFPVRNVGDTASLEAFVDEVRSVSPEATGLAVNILEFGRATSASLREALVVSLIAVTLLIALVWRRLTDTVYAIAPLLLGATLTGGVMVALGWSFNFANVIVIPLLIGMGVDSGVHLVHRARELGEGATLAGTTTARAVFYSAATTITSFGSLAMSSHRGIRSLGLLLVVGMGLTLICNLVVLPAMLALHHGRARPGGDGDRDGRGSPSSG